MADNKSHRLRVQAAHCRKLAKAINDRRSIDALHLTARQFEEQAERLDERHGRDRQRSSGLAVITAQAMRAPLLPLGSVA